MNVVTRLREYAGDYMALQFRSRICGQFKRPKVVDLGQLEAGTYTESKVLMIDERPHTLSDHCVRSAEAWVDLLIKCGLLLKRRE